MEITKLSKCEGEATANNRKGKLIFFYEWVLKLDWLATLDDLDAAEVKGTIEIPNLSEENEPHEVDVSLQMCVIIYKAFFMKMYYEIIFVRKIWSVFYMDF